MRLDHVSYVASHDQISDVVQRIGSQIGTAFVDGGIHPQFGTRNFTAPLLNGQYIEVVCALDHPSVEESAFGKAVKQKANEGGGWLTWVFSTEKIAEAEELIGRESLPSHRRRPDGTELTWRQIGVKDLLGDPSSPFFIQWTNGSHPSEDGRAMFELKELRINSERNLLSDKIGENYTAELEREIKVMWQGINPDNPGIESILFSDGNRHVWIE